MTPGLRTFRKDSAITCLLHDQYNARINGQIQASGDADLTGEENEGGGNDE